MPLGWHWDSKEPTIHPETGRPSCRWCRGRVDPPRRSFCSPGCVEEWTLRTNWQRMREHVYERDGRRCRMCGLDLRSVDSAYWHRQYQYALRIENGAPESVWRRWRPEVSRKIDGSLYSGSESQRIFILASEWQAIHKCLGRDPFETDHIVPVVLGGDWSPRSLQTLCVPCHRKKSREDGSRRGGKR